MAVAGGVFAGFAYLTHKSREEQRATFEREAAADPMCVDVNVHQSWASNESARLRFVRGDRQLQLSATASGSGRSRIELWRAEGGPVGLSQRVVFKLTHEDVFTRAASFAGLKDIQVGDVAIDDALRIKGSDEDIIRAALLDPTVRETLQAVVGGSSAFADQRLVVELQSGGTLAYRHRRRGLTYAEASQTAEALFDLIDALDAVSDIAPVRARIEGGLGGATGAPVGVPIIKD